VKLVKSLLVCLIIFVGHLTSNLQKQVFEKWKEEHDSILKDRIKEKKQTEIKEKLQQVREKEERKKDCTSAFTEW